jgi:hypothetical protein
MKFEWDAKKAVANEKKHGISFHEASSIFGDPLAITFDDPDYTVNEARQLTFGYSERLRLLVVVHTQRGKITRIISARIATRQEKKIYEEG